MKDSPIQLRRPAACPKCGALDLRRIIYGRPMPEAMAMIERGEACLGHCFIERWLPDWRCHACRHEWFDADDPAKQELERLVERIFEGAHDHKTPTA